MGLTAWSEGIFLSHFVLTCTNCYAEHGADMRTLACAACGSTLKADYAEPISANGDLPLPLHTRPATVTLGEGNTPTVRLPRAGAAAGVEHLYAKLEYANPTGSFKDRGSAVMMSAAVEHGVAEVVEDSSGNAGASVSAYAARAGIRAHIFAPASAPSAKLRQIAVYGAQLHAIEGPREAATAAAQAYLEERGLVYASHSLSPFFMEGVKSFAYEVSKQLKGEPPDHIVFPVGNGSLFIGAFKGFEEMVARGEMERIPSLHAVQAAAVRPIVAAFAGETWTKADASKTVAGGISVVDPPHLHRMLPILRAKGGSAVAVSDDEILRWQTLLAEKEGVFGETTSSAAFAGLDELVKRGVIGRGDRVLVPVTGFGLKDAPQA